MIPGEVYDDPVLVGFGILHAMDNSLIFSFLII
jgi:hypothetical protein